MADQPGRRFMPDSDALARTRRILASAGYETHQQQDEVIAAMKAPIPIGTFRSLSTPISDDAERQYDLRARRILASAGYETHQQQDEVKRRMQSRLTRDQAAMNLTKDLATPRQQPSSASDKPPLVVHKKPRTIPVKSDVVETRRDLEYGEDAARNGSADNQFGPYQLSRTRAVEDRRVSGFVRPGPSGKAAIAAPIGLRSQPRTTSIPMIASQARIIARYYKCGKRP